MKPEENPVLFRLFAEEEPAEKEYLAPLTDGIDKLLKTWNPHALHPDSLDPLPFLDHFAQMGLTELPLPASRGGTNSGPALLVALLKRIAATEPALAFPLADHFCALPPLLPQLETELVFSKLLEEGIWLGSEWSPLRLESQFSGLLLQTPAGYSLLQDPQNAENLILSKRGAENLLPLKSGLGLRSLSFSCVKHQTLAQQQTFANLAKKTSLLWKRLMLAAIALGVARKAQRLAEKHAQIRVQFKRPLAHFQLIRHKLVRVEALIQEADQCLILASRAASKTQLGQQRCQQLADQAHALAIRAAEQSADDGMQILGGNGFMEDTGMPKLARDARMLRFLLPPEPENAALRAQLDHLLGDHLRQREDRYGLLLLEWRTKMGEFQIS